MVPRSLLALAVAAAALALHPAWVRAQSNAPEPSDEYTVVLAAPSVGERVRSSQGGGAKGLRARALSSIETMRRAVSRSQVNVSEAIASTGAVALGTTTTVLNAVFIRATPEQAVEVAALPGVRSVTRSRRYRPMLDGVAEIVGLASARDRPATGGLYGDGVKIAIIDSGLDFTHEAFRDDSLAMLDEYPKGDPEYLHLTSPKVIAVRSYVEALNSAVPSTSTPDDLSPWDAGGHGTTVAMVALGGTVETPLGTLSGMAPKARLGVYKVFGTPGLNFYTSERAIVQAIDDAVEDGMDILNLSLGTSQFFAWDATGGICGQRRGAPCNPIAAAADSAVRDFGRVVVAAAGNEAQRGSDLLRSFTTVAQPAAVPSVIAVGSTGNSVSRMPSVKAGDDSYPARSGTGPAPNGLVTGPGVDVAVFGDPLGCEPYPQDALAGAVAVIERGTCFFVRKVELADSAGAMAVVVVNHEGDDVIGMALLEQTDIPAYMVGASSGAAIRAHLETPGATVSLNPVVSRTDSTWDYVALSSSVGPNVSLGLKPDLVAPGENVLSASPRFSHEGVLFAPSGYRESSGTSLSAPAVSGAAALVWEAFPMLDSRQVASSLINSADPMALQTPRAPRILEAGAGLLDIGAALHASAVVVPPSISFGKVEREGMPVRRQLVITNKARESQVFRVSVRASDPDSLARLTFNGASSLRILLPGHRSVRVRVALQGSKPLPGLYEGRISVVSLNDGAELTVPFIYAVSDGDPANAVILRGRRETGIQGGTASEFVVARLTDQFGIPIGGVPVAFTVHEGDARIEFSTPHSDETGLIYARVRYGPGPDPQVVVALAGDLQIPFVYSATGQRPQVEAVVSAASDDVGASPGGLVTVRGRSFTPYASGAPSHADRPLPIMRKSVSVALDGAQGEFSLPARIHSVDEYSVTVQVPWETAGVEDVLLKVRGDEVSLPFPFDLQEAAPGIFTYAGSAGSMAMALHADGSLVTEDAPASAGDILTLVMTGNGPVSEPPPSGAAPDRPEPTVHRPQVWVGRRSGSVVYSGLDPSAAGVYLLTFDVPEGLEPDLHSVVVVVNDVASNRALLPVD
ncbi:MAG: S8 family serine peptidase [Bryobacterales bacterium]|nr:S8 family serine peptidase [Bryobacterales bacterium]